MHLTCHIQPLNTDTGNANLYLEIGAQGVLYTVIENSNCQALVRYDFDAGTTNEAVAAYIHQIMASESVLQQKFSRVIIIYAYPQSVLVPKEFISEPGSKAALELVYGELSERVIRTDSIPGHEIYNVYGVPAVVEMVITRYFANASYYHLFSVLPVVATQPGDHLYCIFDSGIIMVLLTKKEKIQIMQCHFYNTPEDVVYHLLNDCEGFDINRNDVVLHLSGKIEENSAVYNELYKYFLYLQYEGLPGQYQYPDEIYQYPAHYFSHFFSIAACV